MYAEEAAVSCGVTGWVRNLPTGQVEVLIEGDKKAVEEMVLWCHKGPAAANVASVEVSLEPYHGDFTDFRAVS